MDSEEECSGSGSEEYVINKITSSRRIADGEREYLIIWDGYEHERPTWHTEDELYDLQTTNLKKALATFTKYTEEKKAFLETKKLFNDALPGAVLKKKPIPSASSGSVPTLTRDDNFAVSLWKPWKPSHIRSFVKVPKAYPFRLLYMCNHKFLQAVKLDYNTAKSSMLPEHFLFIYKKWISFLDNASLEDCVQAQYFLPEGGFPITDLPADALFTSFLNLSDLRDIIACVSVCKWFNQVLSDGRLWKPVYLSCTTAPGPQTIARFKGNYREMFFSLLEEWGRPQTTRKQASRFCLYVHHYHHDPDRVRKFLEKGIDPNFPGKKDIPMKIALESGNFALINLLINFGGDPSLFASYKKDFPNEVLNHVPSYFEVHKDNQESVSRRYLRRAGWKRRFQNNFSFQLKRTDV